MKSLLYILLVLCFTACQEDPKKVSSKGNALLSVNFSCNELTKDLTSSQEREIKDINIYLFHRTQNISKREYIASSHSTSFNLPKGEYDVFVLANIGYDLGERTKTEIENMDVSISDETDLERNYSLLMSERQTVNITGNMALSVMLKRMVARCDVNINIASGFDFQLSAVKVVDAPKTMWYFAENNPYNGVTYRSHNSSYFSFYILENRKGVNWSITSERDKNSVVAPDKATYLRILGTANGVKAEYRIYLGENNTNSFNVVRNNKYRYDINIKGINEVDSRVSTTVVSFDKVEDTYFVNESIDTNIRLECPLNQNKDYRLAVSVISGFGVVRINNEPYTNNRYIPFLQEGQQSASLPLSYVQSTPSPVQLRLAVVGNDGVLFYRYINSNYVEAPDKLEMSDPVCTDSYSGETSYITFSATKKGESTLKIKYRLLSGAGFVIQNGIGLGNNIYSDCQSGDIRLEFIPSVPFDARMEITVQSGEETVTKTAVVKMYKKVIRHEVSLPKILLYVDDQESAILPLNSCKGIEVIVELVKRCQSCNAIYSVTEKRSETITPPNKLVTNLGIVNTSVLGWHECKVCGWQYHTGKDEVRFRVIKPIKFYDFIGMELN